MLVVCFSLLSLNLSLEVHFPAQPSLTSLIWHFSWSLRAVASDSPFVRWDWCLPVAIGSRQTVFFAADGGGIFAWDFSKVKRKYYKEDVQYRLCSFWLDRDDEALWLLFMGIHFTLLQAVRFFLISLGCGLKRCRKLVAELGFLRTSPRDSTSSISLFGENRRRWVSLEGPTQ